MEKEREQTPGGRTSAVKALEMSREASKLVKLMYSQAHDAAQAGEPVAWSTVVMQQEVMRAFGVTPLYWEHFGAYCAAKQVMLPFLETAEAEGYIGNFCSYAKNCLGYMRQWGNSGKIPTTAPAGGMPKPTMLLANPVCDSHYKGMESIFQRFYPDVPIYIQDQLWPPEGIDLEDKSMVRHYLDYLTDTVKEFVAFMERVLGKKLNIDRLCEVIELSEKAQRLLWETDQLRKAVPSPMPSEDFFACMVPRLYFLGTREAVDFYQRLYDEVKYRVENRIGVIPQEKFRLLWEGIPLWFTMSIFNYFENLGAVFVIESMYHTGAPVGMDLSDPLRHLARRVYMHGIRDGMVRGEESGLLGSGGAKYIVDFVRDYKVDGVLVHLIKSCRLVSCGGKYIADLIKKQTGIPSLLVEGDITDPRAFSEADTKVKIEAFIEMLSAKKEG